MGRKSSVDLYIGRDCVVREIHCKSIIDTTMGSSRVSLHATSDLDYTRPNDFLCWHCAAPFDTPPVPLPKTYDFRQRAFVVEGNFCSLECCKGYIAERCPFDAGHRQLLLKQIALQCYDRDLDAIVAAPPHVALKAFGGNMEVHEFRACRSQVCVATPPFIPQRRVVQMQQSGEQKTGWSVYNLRRSEPEAPKVLTGGERGMYFDYLKQQQEQADGGAPPSAAAALPLPASSSSSAAAVSSSSSSTAPPAPKRACRGALEKFMQ